MDDRPEPFASGVIVGTLVTFIVMSILSDTLFKWDWQKEAIKHGAAYYDHTTATFKWNDEVTKAEND